MKMLNIRDSVGLALGIAALSWNAPALAQNVVVQAPPQQPAPAAAPVVVAPEPVAPAPVVASSDAPVRDTAEHDEWRPNRALLMTGLILGGVPYVASMAVAASSGHVGDSNLWIPIVGPYVDLGNRGGCPASGSCAAETGNKALLIGDGVIQTIGAIEILGSFIFPDTVRTTATVTTSSGASVTFAPAKVGSAGAYGLAAVGRF
jgi:hypothetical protein